MTQATTQLHNFKNNFDFIRFLAASFVLVTHAYALKGIDDGKDFLGQLIGPAFPFSFFGVRIFFLISGFLILQSFERKKSYLDYFWKRLLRIIPGLFVLVIFMIFVFGPLFSVYSIKDYFTNTQTYQMLWSVTIYRLNGFLPGVFVENNEVVLLGSLWTLPYEFSMYIGVMILGAVKLLDKKSFNFAIWIFSIVICVFYPTYFEPIISPWYIPFLRLKLWSVIEFSCFFLGGMLVHQFRERISFKFSIFLVILLVFAANVYFENQLVVRVMIYSLLPYVVFYLGNLKGWLNYFGRYGDFSYGIYIYGFPIQQMLVFLTRNETSVFHIQVLSFVIVLPLSVLSWHLVEKQMLKFKNKFSGQ